MGLNIKQGVNEGLTLCLPFDLSIVEDYSLDIFQQGELVIHKAKEDCTVEGRTVHAELSETESLKLSPQRVSINFRGLYTDGGTVIIEDIPCPIRRSHYRASAGCEASCTGYCTGECSSTCVGGCTGSCSTTCSGVCENDCTGDCTGGCSFGCAETCDTSCFFACEGRCAVGCVSDCFGGCYTACSGCGSGCYATCLETCGNNCRGTCYGSCYGGGDNVPNGLVVPV